MNISTLNWLNSWFNPTPQSFAQINGYWDIVQKCTEEGPSHTLSVASIIFDDPNIQVIDHHGVIRQATQTKHSFRISRDSAHWDVLTIDRCDLTTAVFSITRIYCDMHHNSTYSSAKYYAHKRAHTHDT